MTTWASEVAICNGALNLLGAESIVAVSDSRFCDAYFDQARDECLAAYPWNFAVRRTDLGAPLAAGSEGYPVYEWTYGFSLPRGDNDFCLRVMDTKNGEPYRVEGKWLYANHNSVYITYIQRIESINEWSPHAKMTLSAKLASLIAYPITKSSTMFTNMHGLYMNLLADARQVDTQEGTPDEIRSDEILDARFGYYPHLSGNRY